MRITIFGATGRTGGLLVEQALASGAEVTAIVRKPDGLSGNADRGLHLVVADVMNPDSIGSAVTRSRA